MLGLFAFQACPFNHSDISPFGSRRSLTTGHASGINSLLCGGEPLNAKLCRDCDVTRDGSAPGGDSVRGHALAAGFAVTRLLSSSVQMRARRFKGAGSQWTRPALVRLPHP